CQQHYSYPYNF
nr:immunoglobulin light chain junction region [Macaca mulatta]